MCLFNYFFRGSVFSHSHFLEHCTHGCVLVSRHPPHSWCATQSPPSVDVYPGDAIPSAAGPLVTVTNSRRSDDPEYDPHGDFDLNGAVCDRVLDGARRLLLADYWQLDEPADDFDEEQYIATWIMEMVEARAHRINYVIRPGCLIDQINAYWHRVHKWCHLPENLIRNHGCRDL